MSLWRGLRLAAFITTLAAWPVGIYLSRQHVWDDSTLSLIAIYGIVLGCPAFLFGSAIALRSPTILGMTAALCLIILAAPGSIGAVLIVVCGALWALGVETSRTVAKKGRSSLCDAITENAIGHDD